MPNHRNVYISLATSVSKTGKFQLTPLVYYIVFKLILMNKMSENRKDRAKQEVLLLARDRKWDFGDR